MNALDILLAVVRVVEILAIVLMYLAAVKANRKVKELEVYISQLEAQINDREMKDGKHTYQLVADLNTVSKYLIENLPKVYDNYKVSITLKKYLISYLTYFAEYDREVFDWAAHHIKTLANCDSVASEAKLVYKHITEGNVKKERALQAIVFLIIKTKS